MGHQVMLWDAVGVSHRCVVLIQAPDSVHFIVDAAGDVLYVLHVGPARNKRINASYKISIHKIRKPMLF